MRFSLLLILSRSQESRPVSLACCTSALLLPSSAPLGSQLLDPLANLSQRGHVCSPPLSFQVSHRACHRTPCVPLAGSHQQKLSLAPHPCVGLPSMQHAAGGTRLPVTRCAPQERERGLQPCERRHSHHSICCVMARGWNGYIVPVKHTSIE